MRTYINGNHWMVGIRFKDGDTHFLRRGEKVSSKKEPVSVPEGVIVREPKNTKKITKSVKEKVKVKDKNQVKQEK